MWLPFLSLRFWTFGLGAFGLMGTLLTLLGLTGVFPVLMSGSVGAGLGWGAAYFFRQLKSDNVTAPTTLDAYRGEEARVLLPIRPGARGKIVIESGEWVEMLATSGAKRAIERGETVIVVGVKDGVAEVAPQVGDDELARRVKRHQAAQAKAAQQKRS